LPPIWADWQPNDAYLADLVRQSGDQLRSRLDLWGLGSLDFRKRLDRWFSNFAEDDKPLAEKILWNIDYYSPARFDEVLLVRWADVVRHLRSSALAETDVLVLVPGGADSGDRHAYDLAKVWGLRANAVRALREVSARDVAGRALCWFNDTHGSGNQFMREIWPKLEPLSRAARMTCLVAIVAAHQAVERFRTALGRSVELVPGSRARTVNDVFEREEVVRLQEIGERVYHKWPLGYGDASLLISYYFQCPNNSIPLIWADGSNNLTDRGSVGWAPLFPYRPKK
jgi:hypothetical protein